jgi:hypothetical protein
VAETKVNDVYVFGDSHWRVFFPFVNHAVTTGVHDAVTHTETFTTTGEGSTSVRTIDTTGNGLSGSTMWGLLNPSSRHHARSTILNTLDSLNGTENVGLVFGEVDARYHNSRYFQGDKICRGRIYELVSRYVRFVEEDLIHSGRVKGKVFIYHGFDYPKMGDTLLQPGQPMGDDSYLKATMVNHAVGSALYDLFHDTNNVHVIVNYDPYTSEDGVHLECEKTYPLVIKRMVNVFKYPSCQDRNEL